MIRAIYRKLFYQTQIASIVSITYLPPKADILLNDIIESDPEPRKQVWLSNGTYNLVVKPPTHSSAIQKVSIYFFNKIPYTPKDLKLSQLAFVSGSRDIKKDFRFRVPRETPVSSLISVVAFVMSIFSLSFQYCEYSAARSAVWKSTITQDIVALEPTDSSWTLQSGKVQFPRAIRTHEDYFYNPNLKFSLTSAKHFIEDKFESDFKKDKKIPFLFQYLTFPILISTKYTYKGEPHDNDAYYRVHADVAIPAECSKERVTVIFRGISFIGHQTLVNKWFTKLDDEFVIRLNELTAATMPREHIPQSEKCKSMAEMIDRHLQGKTNYIFDEDIKPVSH